MGNFRQGGNRGGGGGFNRGGRSGGRGGFGGGRSSGFRDRGSFGGGRSGGRDFERRETEMHDAVCSKCGKKCQVPFKPTGSKPVLCSDCFRNQGSDNNFTPRGQNSAPQSSISAKQLDQINAKLDKVLLILKDLEIIEEEGDEDDEELDETLDEDAEDEDEDSEDNSEEKAK